MEDSCKIGNMKDEPERRVIKTWEVGVKIEENSDFLGGTPWIAKFW
jgi:hypothetical protein